MDGKENWIIHLSSKDSYFYHISSLSEWEKPILKNIFEYDIIITIMQSKRSMLWLGKNWKTPAKPVNVEYNTEIRKKYVIVDGYNVIFAWPVHVMVHRMDEFVSKKK